MNSLILMGVLGLLVVLLVVLAIWQRKIDETQKDQVTAELHGARERGTDRALAQHPQIDEEACIGCGSCIEACPEDGVLGLVDGIAHVIHGSRCIGHGLCAVACPVNAVQIGLGDLAGRSDIPILSEHLETSVPGVYISGELGGFALIRIAVEQGTQAMRAIARDLGDPSTRSQSREIADVLIVGAGPAGFAATLKAIEYNLSYITIDQQDVGGTVRTYPRRKLTLTGPLELPLYGRVKREEFLKEELIEFWEKIVDQFGLQINVGVKVEGVEWDGDCFVASTSKGDVRARRVLLALGRRGTPRKLGVPGEEAEKVLYQLVDSATFTNVHILVVGGGDSAVEAATGLANQSGNVVTLSYRRDNFFRLKKRNEERVELYARQKRLRLMLGSSVTEVGRDMVSLACEADGVKRNLQVKNNYVFVCAGGEPPYPLLKGIGVQFNGDVDETAPINTPKLINLQ